MTEERTKYPKVFAVRASDILVTYAVFTCIATNVLMRVERMMLAYIFVAQTATAISKAKEMRTMSAWD